MAVLIALKVFPKLGLVDRPDRYGLKRKPIPYPGGILLYLVFVAVSLIFFEPTLKLLGLLFAGGVLVIVSFLDDRLDLPPLLRIGIQIAVAAVLVAAGIGIASITNPFGGHIVLDALQSEFTLGNMTYTIVWLSAGFTVVWILTFVNTMNWLDGIPGMVSGISAIGGLTLFFLSITPMVNQPDVAALALIVAMMARNGV